jgi:hypothetical protein
MVWNSIYDDEDLVYPRRNPPYFETYVFNDDEDLVYAKKA